MKTSENLAPTRLAAEPLESIVDRAFEHLTREEWGAARDCLDRAIAVAPEHAQLHSSLGLVLFRLEDFQASLAAFAVAVELNPGDPDLLIQVATVHRELGNAKEAEGVLLRALALCPDDVAMLKLLADVRHDEGRHREAARIYGKLIDRHPDQVGIGFALSECFEAVGEWATSAAALQFVLQVQPTNVRARDSLAALPARSHAAPAVAMPACPARNSRPAFTVEVCCPSLNRPKEVIRLRNSLPDDCIFTPSLETQPRALTEIVNELFGRSKGDIVIMAADHLEFRPRCVEVIQECFAKNFPDLDGVVGLNLCNLPHTFAVSEYCFLALGRAFIERFYANGNYQGVFCPEYYHFYGDTEFGLFAEKIGKFHYDERASVFTWHPNAGNAPRDRTYAASRSRKEFDNAMWKRRQQAKLFWGESFKKVGAEGVEANAQAPAPPAATTGSTPVEVRGPFGRKHESKILSLLRPNVRVLSWGTASARAWLEKNLPVGANLTSLTHERGSAAAQRRAVAGKKYDLILIDGDAPGSVLGAAKEMLVSGGVVVVHEAQRVRHDEGKKAFTAMGHLGSCPDNPAGQLWWGGRVELAGNPRASGALPLIISFFTKNTDYEIVARKLIASCEQNNLDYRVVGMDSRGSWEANCSLKAEFVHETWKSAGRPVLWVDADAVMHRAPNLLRGVTADFAIHRCRGWEFASGTLFFNQTAAAGELLARWLARCRRFPQVWDQVNLDLAWEETIATHPLETLWLPEPYCRIFDLHEGRSVSAAVVEHFQASRKLKAKVSTRPNVSAAKVTDALVAARKASRNRGWQLSPEDAAAVAGRTATSLPQVLADAFAKFQASAGKVLCLDNGPGVLWRLLARHGHEVHGLARTKEYLGEAEKWCGDRMQVGSVTALPHRDASFDSVISCGLLELLDDAEVDAALGELKRVARGAIFLVVQTKPDAEERWHGYPDRAHWWQTKLQGDGFQPVALAGLGSGSGRLCLQRSQRHECCTRR